MTSTRKMCDCNQGRLPCTCKPAEQHQGEPVGTLLIGEYFDNREIGEVDVQLDSKACDQLAEKYPGQSMQLYTHADPGEVERLRTVIEQQKNLIASLRAELVESQEFCEGQWWLAELDQLAESGTADQRRAVAVVRNMMRQLDGARAVLERNS